MLRCTRPLAAIGIGALAASGLIAALAPAAGASVVTFKNVQCHATLGGNALPDALIPPQDLKSGATSPASVAPGATFTVTFPSVDTALPAQNSGQNIDNYTDLHQSYTISGASFVAGSLSTTGVPKNNGTPVAGTAKISGNTVTLSAPGPLKPGSFSSPPVSVKVKAGAGGTTVTFHAGTSGLTAHLSIGAAVLTCPLPSDTLASTSVVTPGAPVANDDEASTSAGKAITIDVLANDGKNGFGQSPDPSTLSIVSNPGHGTATVSNGKVVYTPNSSFTTGDQFTYQVCIAVANPTTTTTVAPTTTTTTEVLTAFIVRPAATTATTLRCDTAIVTVSAVQAQAEPTTVATLPRTGSTSAPLTLVGGGLCVLGLAAVGYARRRHVATR